MSSIPDDDLYDLLHALGGSFLRDTIRQPLGCRVCAKPSDKFPTCYPCGHVDQRGLPDTTGFLTYAADGTTAGTLMYGYKSPHATDEQRALVTLLLWHGVQHLTCAEKQVGAAITHLAVVPSTRGRVDHPLRDRASAAIPSTLTSHSLKHVTGVAASRQVAQDDLFTCESLPSLSHVLVVDDTWTSGNKVFSATLALRRAGASQVTSLCVARWLSVDFISAPAQPTAPLLAELANRSVYNPSTCPFTNGPCP